MTPFDILHTALTAEVGLAVQTNNPTQLRLQVYQERTKQQKMGNHIFDGISIFEIPENELWLVDRDVLRKWKNDLEREQDTAEI